jgi:hypothetical protein
MTESECEAAPYLSSFVLGHYFERPFSDFGVSLDRK